VYKRFEQKDLPVNALQDVSLRVGKGDVYGVVGPSGAGKSTLIRCVNLLERPDQGRVIVDSQELTALSWDALAKARRQMGMIFQHFNLVSSRTALANVALPLEIEGMEPKAREARAHEMLDLVGLTDKAQSYPAQLSGGQKQRVGIARALATNPKILLSDEATSALDPQSTQSILALLKQLNEELGLTILLITHQIEVIRQVCDHVALLESGFCVEQGALTDLIADPKSRLSHAFFPRIQELAPRPGAVSAIITFLGHEADQPVLAMLVRSYNVDVNILGGSIQTVAGKRIGQLQVELAGEQTAQALEHLRRLGLRVEVSA
ncbi:MAG TPA: ATP-binding cassette domain-containing protein, partial [Anaerolineaceae bacterium]|nr:ATP-binding cassette domain-containing protein [Anaerolineaceae bacterium]